eukprot:scaffold5717_cov52-Phaeocystis_antarctica.AAC.2
MLCITRCDAKCNARHSRNFCSSCPETSLYMTSTAATARWQQGGNEAMRRHRQSVTATSDMTRKQGGR